MTLHEVVSPDQFEAYYATNGLRTAEEKAAYLTKAMKIRAVCCEGQESPEEALAGLEELALLGFWRASW